MLPCVLQRFEARDHLAIFAAPFAFGARGLDRPQDAAQAVHESKRAADDLRTRGQAALAQQAEQILSSVRENLEATEGRKSGRAPDGVYRTEDLSQQLGIAGTRLQVGEAALHPVQPFLAFEQKIAGQVVHGLVIGKVRRNLNPVCLNRLETLAS